MNAHDATHEEHISCGESYSGDVPDNEGHEKHSSSCERGPRESSSVEERYHQHRADIVDNGQGGEGYFEPERHSRPEQCDKKERECDIGRHWYSPA